MRADEDPEISASGRKVVHSTAVSANSKLYSYLPPEEMELDPDEVKKVLLPALLVAALGVSLWQQFQTECAGDTQPPLCTAEGLWGVQVSLRCPPRATRQPRTRRTCLQDGSHSRCIWQSCVCC